MFDRTNEPKTITLPEDFDRDVFLRASLQDKLLMLDNDLRREYINLLCKTELFRQSPDTLFFIYQYANFKDSFDKYDALKTARMNHAAEEKYQDDNIKIQIAEHYINIANAIVELEHLSIGEENEVVYSVNVNGTLRRKAREDLTAARAEIQIKPTKQQVLDVVQAREEAIKDKSQRTLKGHVTPDVLQRSQSLLTLTHKKLTKDLCVESSYISYEEIKEIEQKLTKLLDSLQDVLRGDMVVESANEAAERLLELDQDAQHDIGPCRCL